MPPCLHLTRSHAIQNLKRRLEHGFPRIEMSLIAGLTGGVGILFSFVPLQAKQ